MLKNLKLAWNRAPVSYGFAILNTIGILLVAGALDTEFGLIPLFMTSGLSWLLSAAFFQGKGSTVKNLKFTLKEVYSNRLAVFIALIYFGLVVAMGQNIESPADPDLRAIYQLLGFSGIIAFLFTPTIWICLLKTSPATAMAQASRVFLAVLSVMYLFGLYGHQLPQMIDSAYEQYTGLIAVLIAGAVMTILIKIQAFLLPNSAFDGIVVGEESKTRAARTTPQDIQFICAHEAGHAMYYATFSELPDVVYVKVLSKPDQDGALGFVSGFPYPHQLSEINFVTWQMHCLLAGKVAEKLFCKGDSLGSDNDNERWVGYARKLLCNFSRGVYYVSPISDHEIKHNQTMINELKVEQEAAVEVFLKDNRAAFNGMVNHLLAEKEMTNAQMVDLLKPVKNPFPDFMFNPNMEVLATQSESDQLMNHSEVG